MTNDACYFLHRGSVNKCRILNKTECDGCAFFKTPTEFEAGRVKSIRARAKLPREHQEYLRDKYYGGNSRAEKKEEE